jgi:predicted lipoprotein with Yx(FWY)xxD motif
MQPSSIRFVSRVVIALAATAAAALPAALADASGVRAKLQLRHTRIGTILVNARGFTVYAFSRDSRDKDACQQIHLCLNVWPPVTTTGKALAGPGVRASMLGTITLRNRVEQVTYAGHPLYTYIGDTVPGQTSYVNHFQLGGRWPALNAAGREVK